MDIEKTMKINELAAELKKHNIFQGFDDAFAKAEEIVISKEEKKQMEGQASEEGLQRLERKFDLLFQENAKIIKDELELLKKAILSVNDEVDGLRKEVSLLKQTPAAQQQEKKEEPSHVKKEKQEQLGEEAPKKEEKAEIAGDKKESNNQRQGKFTPEDVSVDKMFYYGKK